LGFLQKAPLDDKGLTFHFHPANYFRLARTDQLIAKEMIRQQLRRARKGTQVSLARSMGITQDAVSRLEKRTDMLLSTLSHYVEAMGGRLSLVAEFPDGNPVILSGIGDSGPDSKPVRRKRPRAHESESKAQ